MMQQINNQKNWYNRAFKFALLCFVVVFSTASLTALNIYESQNSLCQFSVKEQAASKYSLISSSIIFTSIAAPCPSGADVIGGKVFRDFNYNGVQDGLEPLQSGVEVFLYVCDADGASQTAATSIVVDDSGQYFFSGLNPAQKYRVEFVIPESLDFLGFTSHGAENGTNVQFVQPGTCNVSVGVGLEAEYHQENPFLAAPCYINGSGAAGTEGGDSLAFLAIEYDASGQNQNIDLFSASEVGSLYGVAYERSTKTIFSSAVLRRHMGFGPAGTGGIYFMDVNDINNATIAGVLDLDALGFNTGTDPRISEPLPGEFAMPNYDVGAFSLVGKMSIGDIDISEDGKTLYAINLFNKELISVDLTDYVLNGTFPTAAQVTSTPIPAFNCTSDSDWRVWGLKSFQGDLYIGGVCSAQTSGDAADLTATVVKYDGTSFTEFFDMNLDFQRGDPFNTDLNLENENNQWFPWTDDYTEIRTDEINGRFIHPQPILSDIEFDIDGSMILGFMDRTGHQGGFLNYAPEPGSTVLYSTYAGGDMVRVCNVNGAMVLEGAPGGCENAIGANWPQGPNGKEYYWEDQYPENPTGDRARFVVHNEITLGSLALLPGSGDVVTTVFDPLLAVNAGGISWFDNATGSRDRDYEVFATSSNGGVGFPGKSNGLGDIDLICNEAPHEVGNYVWQDCNGDGIQDACEEALADVNVSLYKEDGTLLATVTTDTDGEYYFNDAVLAASNTSTDTRLIDNTTYYIVFGENGQYDALLSVMTVNGVGYQLTEANSGQAPNTDWNDSDAVLAGADLPAFLQGLQVATYTTGCTGTANHTIDAGFATGVAAISAMVTDSSCPGADDGTIEVTAMISDGSTLEYSFDNGVTFQASNVLTDVAPGAYTIIVQSTGASAGCGSSATTNVVVGEGIVPDAPTTQDFLICMGETIPADSGMSAACAPCEDGTAAVVTWWDAAVGGMQVGTGAYFDPTVSLIDNSIAGTYTYYAQCGCGPCGSDREPATFMVVTNPLPEIEGLDLVCPQATEIYTLVSQINPGHDFLWEILDPGAIIVGSNTGTSVEVLFSAVVVNNLIRIKVTELGPPGTDCSGEDIIEVHMKELSLICNDNIQISLNDDGCAFISPDLVLEGSVDDADFSVNITNQYNESFGNKVSCENIGQQITVKVTNLCDQNSCWATLIVEDKREPIIDCPIAPIEIACTEALSSVPAPTAVDNCTENPLVIQTNQAIDATNACNGVVITRTYIATDEAGLSSEPCIQLIAIQSPGLPNFPSDVTWLCEQYNAFPTITDPTPFASNIVDTDLSTPDIEVPYYLTQTTLASTGSGLIDIAQGPYCNYSSSISDDTIAVCGGIKILRTWSVLNWCTGEVILEDIDGEDNVQIIKIVDNRPPVIGVETFIVNANVAANFPAPCRSTEAILLPTVVDNCSSNLAIRIFTPIGEADYVNGVNANDGANIPSPGLMIGTHTIIYSVSDECGNTSERSVELTVRDTEIPDVVCDEFTAVVINSEGIGNVLASSFDDGSSDNCCISYFEVKRLSAEESAYAPFLLFDCSEVGQTVMVEMQVVDCFDNKGSCTVEVLIDDKERPVCQAPSTASVDCTEYLDIDFNDTAQLDALFGTAIAADNCEATITELEPTIDVSTCNLGTVTRRFVATDTNENTNLGTCEQTINVVYQADFEIVFPPNFTGTCSDMAQLDTVHTTSAGCDLLAVSYSDQFFDLSGDSTCYKIIRHWEVINWCTYESDDLPIELNDSYTDTIPGEVIDETTFGTSNYFAYNQIIVIEDNTAPSLSFDVETTFCAGADCENGFVSLPVVVEDECSTNTLDLHWSYDQDNDGTYDEIGGGIFDGNYPLGNHRVFYTVSDGCGNSSSIETTFEIVDCKAPVAYCNGGIVTDLMNSTPPMIEVWASDLDAGSYDNCEGEVTFSFSSNPLDTGMIFTCEELGINTVQIYIWDEAGNVDVCETFVEIQQNLLISNGTSCASPFTSSIAGAIMTEEGEGLEDAMVELNGTSIAPISTNAEGQYVFDDVELGYDYSITTTQDTDADNGVTVYDLVMIRAHILSNAPITSPYKLIAADANNSQSVTTSDIIALRRLILTLDTEFTNNTSWRFVDASFVFPNPQNPWESSFPEVISINNLDEEVLNANFVAIKVGDINGNAQANLQSNSEERTLGETLHFNVEDADLKENTTYTLEVKAKDYEAIAAYQFTLNYDVEALEFQKATGTAFMPETNIGLARAETGILTLAHNEAEATTIQDETVLFALTFTTKKAGKWSDFIQTSSEFTKAIAYRQNGQAAVEAMDVAFDFFTAANGFSLYQNRPNPFFTSTIISFNLEEGSKAKLSIFDVNGKLVKVVENDFAAGYHEVNVERSELGTGSVFYYQLDTDNHSAVRKMVLLK